MLNGLFDNEKSDLFKPKNAKIRNFIYCLIILIILLLSIIFVSNLYSKKINTNNNKPLSSKYENTGVSVVGQASEDSSYQADNQAEELGNDEEWVYEVDPEQIKLQNTKFILPVPPQENPRKSRPGPTFFISVASYRDMECLSTVRDLFNKAKNPNNIYLGIAEQNKFGNESCLDQELVDKYTKQIRSIHIPSNEASGPTYGRFLTSLFYRDETYYVQIDSHLRWIQNWDEIAINMFKKCPQGSKCIFTHYPPEMSQYDKKSKHVPLICRSFFGQDDLVSWQADPLPPKATLYPSPLVAAGFLIGPGSMIKDVPFDPNLPYLFVGEEILHSARLWTSGYDFFSPTHNIVFHHYTRSKMPKVWSDPEILFNSKWSNGKVKYFIKQDSNPQTTAYAKNIVQYERDRKLYGLGSIRSVEEYHKFIGIDFNNQKMISRKKFCDIEDTEK